MKPIAYEVISIALSVITFGIILYIGIKTDILRESIPNVSVKDRMYSFGRFQLWVWTLIICPIFALYWGYSGGHSIDLNTTTIILLGIPSSVAVTSNVISSSQSGEMSQEDHIDAQVAAKTKKDTAKAHNDAVARAIAGKREAANDKTNGIQTSSAPTVLKMHQTSKSFFIDLISGDDGQLSLGRLQQLIFTMAFLVIYLSSFFSADMKILPEFGNQVYILMGISSGTYLVSKGLNE